MAHSSQQWSITDFQKKERVDFAVQFRVKPVEFWLEKVYVDEHRYK